MAFEPTQFTHGPPTRSLAAPFGHPGSRRIAAGSRDTRTQRTAWTSNERHVDRSSAVARFLGMVVVASPPSVVY